jgi:DNA (cytosine-5)-methyltransferase 1
LNLHAVFLFRRDCGILRSMLLERPWDVFSPTPTEHHISRLSHISLFSGCGGFDLGFRQAGFKTIFANDLDEDACSTFQTNLGEITPGDITSENFVLPTFSDRPDVLTAGFPCQPFSNAGSRRGVDDHRGELYDTAIALVEKYRPRSIVFENVRGLVSTMVEGKLLIEIICERLTKLNYDVVFRLVDASDHHVPQRRLRLFIIGIEKTEPGRFAFPPSIDRSDLTIEHTIFDLDENVANQNEVIRLNPQALYIGSLVPEGGSWKSIPYDQLPERLRRIKDNIARYRWPNFYRKFRRDEIAGTVTAAFKPENAGVWHPIHERPLSVREIARIQSFPDWFQFEGKAVKSKYKQIGNAVPPRLAYEIAVRLRSALGGADQRSTSSYISFDRFLALGRPLRSSTGEVVFAIENKQAHLAFDAC